MPLSYGADPARLLAPEDLGVARSRRRRLLVLAPRDPYPVIGGDRVRIHNVARELAVSYDLTLLTFCRNSRERDAPLPTDGVFSHVRRIILPSWQSWLNTLAALPTREPLQVAYYKSAEFREAVEELAPSHDGVLAHLVRTAEYARDLPMLRILEMTDAISMNMRRVAALDAGYFDVRKWIYAAEAPRLRAYEQRAAADFHVVSLVSAVDKAFLLEDADAAGGRVLVVANGVEIPVATPPPPFARNANEIAFVGHMSTLQNYDAAWFFAHKVLPLIRARRPDAVFRVIGPYPPSVARRLGSVPGVRLEGIVPSLTEALATARVGVCPTRAGSGIQNKVLNYFANRLAVVCSPIGAEGIDARHNHHLLIAKTASEWAAQVLHVLDDDALAQRLADAGRALARTRYRWGPRAEPLASRLDQLFDQQGRSLATVGTESAVASLAPALVET